MAALTTLLLCGCPALDDAIHNPGCWLADAEAIAAEAITATTPPGKPGAQTIAVVQALVEAGFLHDPDGDAELLGLVDLFVESGLLHAAERAEEQP